MRKPLHDRVIWVITTSLLLQCLFADEMLDSTPNNMTSGLAGKAMRHYAVPAYTGSSAPQLYAVQPQYPQYYFGPQPQNPCLLPQQVGTGPYRIPRWYFNPARQACELFYWSGCCGNSNNFQTYHDCQKRCEAGNAGKPNTVVFVPFTLTFTMKPTGNNNLKPLPTAPTASCPPGECPRGHLVGGGASVVPITPKVEPTFIPVTPSAPPPPPPGPPMQLRPIFPTPVSACEFELDAGVGSMEIIRYYYNKHSRVCEEFRYRGQGGNRNNFLSLPECRKVCPESPSPCAYGDLTPANQPLQCQPGTSLAQTCGGEQFCHIGASPQTTVCCPKPADVDPCGQPLTPGVGNANLQRWYFNSMAQQCQPMQYRGLQGNENNFLTQNACQVQCQVNPCRVGIPFRNPTGGLAYCSANDASECPTGYYCHIGATSQTSLCCQALDINPCKEEKIEGEGLERLIRYYFDVERKECMPFEYRGFKGNANNFVSKMSCERRCPVWVNPCAKGQPILDLTNKPELCYLGRPCPQNYYCHIGFNDDTTVCCPASSANPCNVPLNQGTGFHMINRWYFNPLSRQCERFVYKGNHGNENNFLVRDQCEATCPSFANPCPTGEPLMDNQNLQPRFCDALDEFSCPPTHFCHFGHSNKTRVCCPGKVDPCLLAHAKGEGPNAEPRWYFDISLKQCLPFGFYGMKGNGNNFATKEQCERKCPVFIDPCPDSFVMNVLGVSYHPPVHYQKCSINAPGSCPSDHWCHVGENADTTLCCPNAGDPCAYPSRASGVGNARLERWTYNSHGGRCDPFIYHGQKGNQNNFLSNEECSEKCIGRDTVIASPPVEPQKFQNPCNTGFPLVSAQSEILQCMESRPCPRGYYCHIGTTDITTVCCPAIGSDPCGQPLDSGTGGARLQRWYWNAQAGCCQLFNYCGLRGTQNNFLTREDCEQTCMEFENPCASGPPEMLAFNKPKLCGLFNACASGYWCHMGAKPQTTVCCPHRVPDQQVCQLPLACGRGTANLQRWYYDARRGCCVMFVYNGKYGNQNNFLTLQDCQKACVGPLNSTQTPQHITPLTPFPQSQILTITTTQPSPTYRNHCPFDEPLLEKLITQNGTTLAIRPIKCTFENENEVCGETFWCFLGVTAEENMCCPGGARHDTACSGRALLDGGSPYEDVKAVLRWMYDIKTNECFAYRFKGSKGNQNNFLTEEECLGMCQVINPCKLPIPLPLEQCIPGPNACAARPNMYCHVGAVPQTTVCCPAETPNPCELPLDPGVGRDRLERWFYNAQTSICQPFTYNGIKGNQNNFLSQQDCELLCVPNPCAEGRPFVGADGRPQTCSPSASMNTCPAEHWCHVGATQLTTVCCPAARPNPCILPMSTGEGDASLERFYFDQSSKTCKPFEYRGLKGNQNNFLSQRACQLACQPLDNPCIGQPATTPTGQVLFCSSTNKDTCPVNFWCHLGSTPETTVCCPGATNPCSVPLAPGTGNSGLSRWYYNTDERQCIPFQYNGKRGNQNNFLTQNECERTCPEQLCLLSIDKGACSGRQTRFAFNRQTSQCVPFEYTGCGGNLNNFLTMEDCVATCGNVGF